MATIVFELVLLSNGSLLAAIHKKVVRNGGLVLFATIQSDTKFINP